MPSYGIGTTREAFDHELPSGNTCLMHRLGVNDLVRLGMLDQLDELQAIVQTDHIDRVKGGKAKPATLDFESTEGKAALLSIIKDRAKWTKLQVFMGLVVSEAVVEPKVLPEPEKREDRKFGELYSGDVDFADQISIMSAALGGLADSQELMKPFRAGSAPAVDHLLHGKAVQHPPVDAGGDGGGASGGLV